MKSGDELQVVPFALCGYIACRPGETGLNKAFGELRIGLIGLGLSTYWPQFADSSSVCQRNLDTLQGKLENARELSHLGLIDSPEKAVASGHLCRQQDIDILLVYVTTYALSSRFCLLFNGEGAVVCWNLQPEPAIDYAT